MGLEPISASELERYGYCPLSWWLSLKSKVTSEELEKGDKQHAAHAEDLSQILEKEKSARLWERVVLIFSIAATGLGIVGSSLIGYENSSQLSTILGILAIVWIVAAVFFLFRSATSKSKKEDSRNEQIIAVFAIVAMLIALNAVTVLEVNPELAFITEILALIWLIGASFALYASMSSIQKAEIIRKEHAIEGEIKYVDKGKPRLLRSNQYGLNGRPDYILEMEGELIPVELKSGRTPKGPLFSHLLQVAAYCLMLQEEGGKVTHGILKYEEAEHEIEFNEDLRHIVISKVSEMRELKKTGDVHRNHNRPGKCRSCSRREMCPERLA